MKVAARSIGRVRGGPGGDERGAVNILLVGGIFLLLVIGMIIIEPFSPGLRQGLGKVVGWLGVVRSLMALVGLRVMARL
ncbi:hypothetical protein, partial [Actinomyces qiguomingii]|uniref:hypothetical protein n=1 Tax=Actinomyces qiguomingii TaxID=2057800 RepID=UPI001E4D1530